MARAQTDNGRPMLTPKMRGVIAELVNPQCGTLLDVAAATNVAPATIRRWRKLPHFAAALADAVADLRADVTRRLHGCAALAVEVLRDGMAGNATRVQVRCAELTLRFVYGERIAVEQITTPTNYVIEVPPTVEDMEAWAEQYDPQRIAARVAADAAQAQAGNGHSNGNGHQH